MTLKDRLYREFGYLAMDESPTADNLGIALCQYFESHPDRPEDDEDTDSGWGQWVEDRACAIIDKLVQIALATKGCPYCQGGLDAVHRAD